MNLRDIFFLEYSKNKRRWNFIVLTGLFLIQLLYMCWGMNRESNLPQGWIMQLFQMPLLNAIFMPTVLAVLASRHIDEENKGSLWKVLFTLERPEKIYAAKLLYGAFSVFLFCLAQTIMMLACGLWFHYASIPDLNAYFLYFANTFAVSLVLYLLQMLLSFIFANQAVALSVGLCGSMAGLFLMYLSDSLLHRLIPWGLYGSTMFVRMDWNRTTRETNFYYVKPSVSAYIFLAGWIALLLAAGIYLFCTWEADGSAFLTGRKNGISRKNVSFSHLPAEYIKVKRTPVWLAGLALPSISAVIGTVNYMGNLSILDDAWYSLWSQHTLFLCYFFMPPTIAVFNSFLWRLEHTGTNWNQLMVNTSPVKIIKDKMAVSLTISYLSLAWIVLLYIAGGKIAGITEPLPQELINWILLGAAGCTSVCAAQLFLSLIIHNFALPIGIALCGGILGLMLSSKGYWYLLPYSVMSLGMRANNPYYDPNIPAFLLTCALFVIFFIAASMIYLRQTDVKTQE